MALLSRLKSPKLRQVITLLLYLAIIVGMLPASISLTHRIVFILYALFIFWILYGGGSTPEKTSTPQNQYQQKTHWLWHALFLFAILYLVFSRLYLFARFGEAPLGYDTGFYWEYFRLIVPAGSIGTSVGSHLVYSSWFPLGFFKLPALTVIHILHVFHQLLTAGALYFLLRSLPLKRASYPVSVLGVLLFAFSINQFMAFWWMFYKQSLALPFLLLAIGLFLRRSPVAIPVAGFAAALHISSAVPLGAALILFFIFQLITCIVKRRRPEREFIYLAVSGILAMALVVALRGTSDIDYYLTLFLKYKGLATNARSWEIEQIRGLFIPFSTFRLNALFYLPFALIGILQPRRWIKAHPTERTALIPIMFAASLILVSFPFIHQTRSLVFFDILLIIFAAPPLFNFIRHFARDRHGTILPGLLCLGLVAFTSRVVWNQEPQLYGSEAAELKLLERKDIATDIRKIDDYVMVTSSLYTPWAYAFTGFGPTIVPGWLTWDKWDLDMWEDFWFTNNNERRLELLEMYGDNTIYIFIGEHQSRHGHTPRLKEFIETDPHFTRFSPHIWKYTPHPENTNSSAVL